MPKVSVNILTKNRPQLLQKALASIVSQKFENFEVLVICDGGDFTEQEKAIEKEFTSLRPEINFIYHDKSLGITISRQEALQESQGEYVAILDDDDEWVDSEKLAKQAKYLDAHPEVVLVGGGIMPNSQFPFRQAQGPYSPEPSRGLIPNSPKVLAVTPKAAKLRAKTDTAIRNTMLLRNNFFTSTVLFRRQQALEVGGFIKDHTDLAEDYDLWLRLGQVGKMHNFAEVFTAYSQTSYNKAKFRQFLNKQLELVKRHRKDYPHYFLASLILKIRLLI